MKSALQFCLGIALGAAVTTAFFAPKNREAISAMSMLSRPDQVISGLALLLGKNDIRNLPDRFSFWTDEGDVEVFESTDAKSNRFAVASVSYPAGTEFGDRSYSFLFNQNGKCILHGPETTPFHSGGLLELTGDGNLEKIIVGPAVSTHLLQTSSAQITDRLHVFRLNENTVELLLDVDFHTRTGAGPNDPVDIILNSDVTAEAEEIQIRGPDKTSLGTFIWSPVEGKYVLKNLDPRHVLVSFPAEVQPSYCRIHPTVPLDGGRVCPVCSPASGPGGACPLCGYSMPLSGACPMCQFKSDPKSRE